MDKSDQPTPTAMRTAESWAVELNKGLNGYGCVDLEILIKDIRAIQKDALKSARAIADD